MGKMRLLVVTAGVVAVVGVGAGAASAGEITGNGTYKGANGKSACSFSGQEDLQWFNDDGEGSRKDPADVVKGDPAHSQNWGHVKQATGLTGGAGPQGCNPHVGEG